MAASKPAVFIRCTEEQKAVIEQAAARAGLPVAAWALEELLRAARGEPAGAPASSSPRPPVVTTGTSRSVARRLAVQRGAPAPSFKGAPVHGEHCQCLACRSSSA